MIERTLIVLLPTNVTTSKVELKVLSAKKTPSFRLFAIPDPSSCSVHGGTPLAAISLRTQSI